jgi:hypothetical protein
MTTQRPLIVGFLLAIVLVGSGCASMQQQQGTVVPITKENLASLAGVWNGWAYAGANGFPGELTLRQDGYFNNSVGAFTSTGTFQLQNGSLVANPYVSGGLNNADANITVQLMQRSNGQRYLSGTGTSNGGPYSFEYNKR